MAKLCPFDVVGKINFLIFLDDRENTSAPFSQKNMVHKYDKETNE